MFRISKVFLQFRCKRSLIYLEEIMQEHLIEHRVFRRFPRVHDKAILKRILYVTKLRAKYPLPAHDPRTGYSNPGLYVLDWLIGLPKEKLKFYAGRYGLDNDCGTFKLIKRIYLFWRTRKLQLETFTPPPKPQLHYVRLGFHLGRDKRPRFPRVAQGTRFPRLRLGDTLWTKPKPIRKKRKSRK